MDWSEAERRIRRQIVPASAVLKCDGIERRKIVSNGTDRITIRTGVSTSQTKTISYEMLKHAFDVLETTGRFDSAAFRRKFQREYAAAPCRYSMTGGVLVEVGVAEIEPGRSEGRCRYIAVEPRSD